MTLVGSDGVFVLRADGRQLLIRTVGAGDWAGLQALNDRMSAHSIYLRFFSANRDAARAYYRDLCVSGRAGRLAVLAVDGDEIVGIACAERAEGAAAAEMALLVDDAYHGLGVGTLLLEHLMSRAREEGIETFAADVLVENHAMLRVLHDLGYQVGHHMTGSETYVTWTLAGGEAAQAAVDAREAGADTLSLRPILQPRSVAIIGASSRERSVGGGLLKTILDGGFRGAIYPVNPNHGIVQGLVAYPCVAGLPEAPDLAIIAVPAAAVLATVQECGERGVRGIVLVTSGFREVSVDGTYREREVAACAHRYGMRLIGPNCLGVMNADPEVRLAATFSGMMLRAGGFGLASQSGALGIAVVAAAERRGVGLSQFVSLGNKADVSGNDLLEWWAQDSATRVIGLYLESFGNPRKFARIARAVSRHKPILALKSGRTVAGQRAGLSHTAAAAAPDVIVDALCAQAGVIRVHTLEELIDAAVLLDSQPLPAGPRVAIVGNSGGPQILAADAAGDAGLSVVGLSTATVLAIRTAVPQTANASNPVDIGGGMDATALENVLGIVVGSREVDAVLVIVAPTAAIGPDEVRVSVSGQTAIPVVPVVLGGAPNDEGQIPVFEYPESAAVALAHAWRYVQLRGERHGSVASPCESRPERLLAEHGDGLLEASNVAELLADFNISCSPQAVVRSAADAVRRAGAFGYPVAMKVTGMAHKTDIGGVRLDVRNSTEVETAFAELSRRAPGILVQPMAGPGTELIMGAMVDPTFGPLVMLGVGGVSADLLPGRSFRLAPLSDVDAEHMVASLPEQIIHGFRGADPIDPIAVAAALLRVSDLVGAHPEIVELDLNPVTFLGDQMTVLDAKVTIGAPYRAPDALAPCMT